ncbi:MAG: hypothetical protein JNK40_07345 [Chromatiales bacterium]|nr:hypothetical protein [Chromatiales bacterium]
MSTWRTRDQALAASLNSGCACRTLDPERLRRQLEGDPSLAGLAAEIAGSRPHLFSSTAVFVSPRQLAGMQAIVSAVEQVVALPGYQQAALARAPDIARLDPGPRGAFMGFDFHPGPDGPRLIEINTNAGGALLNSVLARAQQACCQEMAELRQPTANLDRIDETFVEMFRADWRRQRGDETPDRIAIVDDTPPDQYLYPEFQLFRQLFERHGIEAVIADAAALEWRDHSLQLEGRTVPFVYNRLTDFHLESPAHAALRDAYLAGGVVMTPNPHAHALYADKRNLVTLSNDADLAALGVPDADRAVLRKGVPTTVPVTAEAADELWSRRRQLFFKPARGYGSKAAYRGDKLTRRVWNEILAGDYVAQLIAPAGERLVRIDGALAGLKLDIRAYAYAGHIQLLAARLYAGQTTNFRTAGGGFAPVFVVPA